MNNFVYHNPVKLIFGKGQISRISQEIPENARILLTYGGGSIFKNGVYDQVKKALGGRFSLEFGGIEPNPKYETLIKAVEAARSENIDFILAVGGGSVLDGSKFIAAAFYFIGDPWDILSKGARIEKSLPIGSVLTLPATGSEMNANSVVSHAGLKQKRAFSSPHVFPRFSVCDPTVTFSLPQTQVVNGIVDSFVHVTEQYLTYPSQAPLQDRMAESLLVTLIEEGPKAIHDAGNYNIRANLMWCSTMALNGLIGLGVPSDWSTHGIGHQLTALHGLDHALTLAIVLPGVLKVMKEEKKEKLISYGQRVWKITNLEAEETADAAIDATDNFFRGLGLKTRLGEHGIGQETIDIIVERFSKPHEVRMGERGTITPEIIRQILTNRL